MDSLMSGSIIRAAGGQTDAARSQDRGGGLDSWPAMAAGGVFSLDGKGAFGARFGLTEQSVERVLPCPGMQHPDSAQHGIQVENYRIESVRPQRRSALPGSTRQF